MRSMRSSGATPAVAAATVQEPVPLALRFYLLGPIGPLAARVRDPLVAQVRAGEQTLFGFAASPRRSSIHLRRR